VSRLALDSSALIYLVEGATSVRERVTQRVAAVLAHPSGQLVASRLSRLECRVRPLRDDNQTLLQEYEALFEAEGLVLIDVSAAILDRATALRAQYRFKTPDAIHLASALEAGADAFLTGDTELARCPDLNVELVAP
jgi:uncharacterized protein